MEFRISEKYRLEVHWTNSIYEQEGTAKLEGCYFSGPAVKDADQVNDNDSILLDFAYQYIVFVPSFYIAKLSWEEVKQSTDRIDLSNALLTNRHVNSVPKLNNDDYIVIDAKDHESETHYTHLTYESYLVKHDGDLYKFGDR